MKTQAGLILFSCLLMVIKASVLLWSTNKLEISPLNTFKDEDLEELIKKLEYPDVAIYTSTNSLLPEFENLLDGYHTSYNPNGYISTENATGLFPFSNNQSYRIIPEITTSEDLLFLETKKQIELSKDSNVLSILIIPSDEREKREIPSLETTEETLSSTKGPVLYRAKAAKGYYALLYSPQALVLKTVNSSIELGEATSVTVDEQMKINSVVLAVTTSLGEEKLKMQFIFTWFNDYWSLTMVKVKSTTSNNSMNLTLSEPFSVPAEFSYHCSETTIFTDIEGTTELSIFNLQVQPSSPDGDFGDAYDCVDFMTVPIWSGLFVTGILGLGMIVALVAIGEIKTMDKFDNQRTKQLVLTLAE